MREQSSRTLLNWKVDDAAVRAELRMGPFAAPWTSKHPTLGVPATWGRERSLIDVAWEARLQQHAWTSEAEASRDFFADISQGVKSSPWRTGLGALCQGSVFRFRISSTELSD